MSIRFELFKQNQKLMLQYVRFYVPNFDIVLFVCRQHKKSKIKFRHYLNNKKIKILN